MGCRGPFAFEGSRSMSAKPRPADGTHAWPCCTTKDAPRRVKCCRARVHQRTHQFLFLPPAAWPLTHTRGRATATARPGWRCVQFTICGPHAPRRTSTFRRHPAAFAILLIPHIYGQRFLYQISSVTLKRIGFFVFQLNTLNTHPDAGRPSPELTQIRKCLKKRV